MLTHHVEYADLYFQYSRAEGWALEEGIVKSGSFNIDQGVGVRAVSGDKTAFAYSDDISMPALASAAQATRAIARHGVGTIGTGGQAQQRTRTLSAADPIASLKDTDKVALLEKLEGYARALDKRVIQVMASLAGEYEVVLVARSDGLLAADVRPLVRISCKSSLRRMAIANKAWREEVDALIMHISPTTCCAIMPRKQYIRPSSICHAKPAPAGTMTVVLGAGWPGILLHEAIGHGLEGDFNRKGSSAFSGRIGERVAADGRYRSG